MSKLAGSKTEQNLKDAFAGESQANRRYLYFAQKAVQCALSLLTVAWYSRTRFDPFTPVT